jgi:glycerol-3-phosphate dehydrogenase
MNRTVNLQQLKTENFDICIIGGGASGAGCALDAAMRGYKVALVEQNDFASATSSKSTKLIHGGVRYLEEAFKKLDFGQLRQVRHGLHERHTVIRNAPHLAHGLPLVTPVFSWFEGLYFTIGLKLYDFIAGNDPLPKSEWLNKKEAMKRVPTLAKKTHSAVLYYDGQLDDARYCLALAQTASEVGAVVTNHTQVLDFQVDSDKKLNGATLKDLVSGEEFSIKAKIFLNCTGPAADRIRLLANKNLEPRIRPSKGVHLILPYEVLNSDSAMLIPKTSDGRVVFAIPFEGKTLLGTTDNDYKNGDAEPILEKQEIDFLLETLERYLEKKPEASEVKAGYGGLRPLLAASGDKSTKKLVRDHEVEHDESSNLLSLMGGKWTTYRLMAQDSIDKIDELLGKQNECLTAEKYLVGGENYDFEHWKVLKVIYGLDEDICQYLMKKYGTKAENVANLAKKELRLAQRISPKYPYIQAEVVYGVQEEMACLPRDILARRMRLEFLDWQITHDSVPVVAELMAQILGWNSERKAQEIQKYQNEIKGFMMSIL